MSRKNTIGAKPKGAKSINSIGGADDYTSHTFLSKRGLDPNRDVTFRTIGGTSARFGALLAGAVDATAVSSPYEYKAEQSGLRILVPFKETAEYIKLPNAGLVVTQAKAAKDGAQVVRVLKALRSNIVHSGAANSKCRPTRKNPKFRTRGGRKVLSSLSRPVQP